MRFDGISTQAPAQQIVLLEDSDLYRYHLEEQQRRTGVTLLPDADAESLNLTMSAPSYRGDADRSTTHFHLHATPFASSMRKHSATSLDTTAAYQLGALRPGGPVNLFDRQHVALLVNFFIDGFFNSSVTAIVYPLLYWYLGYNDVQLNAAFAMLNFSLLFKFPAGFLTDCIPINRQRRKPYILIGWAMSTIFMVVMAFTPQPQPYKKDGVVVYADAASQGSHYVIPLVAGAFSHLVATVAIEGMMIECAQRESEFTRGYAFSVCMIFRFLGEVAGGTSVSLSLNSTEYGGTFAVCVPVQAVFAVHALLAALGVVLTKFFFHEERTSISTQRLPTQLRRIWSIMQQRTTWQILIFGFCERLGSSYEIQGYRLVFIEWLGANSLSLNILGPMGSSGSVVALWIFKRFFINANWRKLIVVSVLAGLVVMIPIDVITVLNIVRDPMLFTIKEHFVSFTDAWLFIVRCSAVIEIAEPGYEAVTFGIFTTVFNLASMVVSMAKNIAAAYVDPVGIDLKADTDTVRGRVMGEFMLKYVLRLVLVLGVLPLLPRQKRHLKERKLLGSSTIVIPVVLFVAFVGLFTISVTSNLLALFDSTACLPIAGGTGCNE